VSTLSGKPMTAEQLDSATRAFADRYVVLVSTACDAVRSASPSPRQRREAQILKINCASGAYDIATEPDAFTRLLDLLVLTTLESQVWIDDGKAKDVFPDDAQLIIDALRRGRVEAWEMAATTLPPDQLDVLDYLIWEYRKNNPQAERVAWVRMADFAATRQDSGTIEVQGNSFFAPVSEATKTVDETRLLLERIFYLLKREPTLLRWQAEGFKDDLIATPELAQSIDDVHRLTAQVEQLPEHVAAERKATFEAVDAPHAGLDYSLRTMKQTLTEASKVSASLGETARSLNEMLRSADALMTRYEKAGEGKPAATEPSRPFDIRDYTSAVKELAVTIDRMNTLVHSSNDLLGSPEWDRRIAEVNTAADGRVRMAAEQSRQVVNMVFQRVYVALGALLVLLVSYRLIVHAMLRWLKLERAESARLVQQDTGASTR
jgi:hypothetical protein